MTENNITKDDIAEIIIDPPTYLRMAYYPEGYTSLTQAQFSMPFMLASYILDPTPSSKWLREEKLKDKELLAIAAKVKSGPSEPILMPSAFKNFQKGRHPVITVTIKTNDGKEYSETMEKHLGHPGNMMTEEQFKDRFRVQASACMSGERLEQTVELLANVDDCPDMAEVAKLLHR
jgi:2-methylcitrate dehydratase PrpD